MKNVYSASRISGLNKAQSNLKNALNPLSNVKKIPGPFSGTNIARAVGNAASNYNTAYSSVMNAQILNFVILKALYPSVQFSFKQLIGHGINQII